MLRSPRFAVMSFVLWTLFAWGQRLVNISDADLEGFDLVWSTGRAVIFVVAALAVAGVELKGASDTLRYKVVAGAAALTVALWSVQVVLIAIREYETGFIIVHAVLGVVSIALAIWATRLSKLRATGSAQLDRTPGSVVGA